MTLPTTPASSDHSAADQPVIPILSIDGETYVAIDDYHSLPPFFCTLTTDSDLWLFVSSTGGLTAGRISPDHAILPYETVDKIHDGATHNGPIVALRWSEGGVTHVWEPFVSGGRAPVPIQRRLLKNVEGSRLVFEESLPELKLRLTATWMLSPRYGVVRHYQLSNTGATTRSIEVVHGLRNLVPTGIDRKLQSEYSCLADAYKQNELLAGSGIGVFCMASGITDHPVPCESLRATVAWSLGLRGARRTVDAAVIRTFTAGAPIPPTLASASRGVRANYLEWANIVVPADHSAAWLMAADTGLDQVAVSDLASALDAGLAVADVIDDVVQAEQRLRRFLAAADGIQASGDAVASAHHMANVLFNTMRGGIFPDGYVIPTADFKAAVARCNRQVAARHAALLDALPPTIHRSALRTRVEQAGDPQLTRLFLEYLPLSFSRRHGDPSRPWNLFAIRICDQAGNRLLTYQGNWRDIFQNWEALALSFPAYIDGMISKFVNASTADGYNPYRITSDGIDWEEPEPDNPWAAFGYWGDHQIVYLLKLLELCAQHYPGRLESMLGRSLFTYANVPYRMKPYREVLKDPRNTLECDVELGAKLRAQAAAGGSDFKLVIGSDNQPALVNLVEKLLVPLLAKWCNFVPGGGIWMNTQRPEWNDANNALVGNGLSMVTLYYMRRHQQFLLQLLESPADAQCELSAPVATLLSAISAVLGRLDPVASCADPAARRTVLDAMGEAGDAYRAQLQTADWTAAKAPVAFAAIRSALLRFQTWADATIRLNQRADGLYHAYNLLVIEDSVVSFRHLDPALEGQVAVLSSGLLSATECDALLSAMRTSALFCPRRNSYLLYPDKQATPFLAKNQVPPASVADNPLVQAMLARDDHRILRPDPVTGCLRFNPDFKDASFLAAKLAAVTREPAYADCAQCGQSDLDHLLAVYESVFHHHAFTGRSGSMFAYEGLGSIYWHMVSKLLLAIQENLARAAAQGVDPLCRQLDTHYAAVRDGLGFRKSARAYGAFPTDPYSHTPAHAGAQQPGMTGQVKEEILTRRGELGLSLADGTLRFHPLHQLLADELPTTPIAFHFIDGAGTAHRTELPAGCVGFTVCQTPVILNQPQVGHPATSISVALTDGSSRQFAGPALDAATCSSLFRRDGTIQSITVHW
jgi:hypothetical protein